METPKAECRFVPEERLLVESCDTRVEVAVYKVRQADGLRIARPVDDPVFDTCLVANLTGFVRMGTQIESVAYIGGARVRVMPGMLHKNLKVVDYGQPPVAGRALVRMYKGKYRVVGVLDTVLLS